MARLRELPSRPQRRHGQKTSRQGVDLKTALLSEIEQIGLWNHCLDISSKNSLALALLRRWGLRPDDEATEQHNHNLQSIVEWCNSSWLSKRGLFTPLATSLSSVEVNHRPLTGTPPCKSGQLKKDLGLEVSSARHAVRLARLITFEIMMSFFVGSKCFSRSPFSGFAIHRDERMEPSARSPSVLAHYATLTSIAFDFAIGVIGRCTLSTPSRKSAVTFEPLASSGSVKLRRKLPKARSTRWNFRF
jgi:hypothetical protein